VFLAYAVTPDAALKHAFPCAVAAIVSGPTGSNLSTNRSAIDFLGGIMKKTEFLRKASIQKKEYRFSTSACWRRKA